MGHLGSYADFTFYLTNVIAIVNRVHSPSHQTVAFYEQFTRDMKNNDRVIK